MRVFLIAFILLALAPLPASALDKIVSVTGEGEVSAAPDMAIVRLGVSTQAQAAREASDANARKMTALIAAVKAAGVADADIQTSRLSLFPQMSGGNNPRVTGFNASNEVTVKVRDLAGVSGVLDRAIAAGANEMSGIEFVVSQRSQLLDKARTEAVADARRKAEVYAAAAGVSLGRPVEISEAGATPPQARPMVMRHADAASVPVAAGEQALRLSVTVTYELQ